METKSNNHEMTIELHSLNSKIEDMYRDVSKRLQQCAMQKDIAYI